MSDQTDYFNDLTQIPVLIAEDIVITATGLKKIDSTYLSSKTVEVTYNSNYNAPDTVTLTMVDPDWTIQTSGLCSLDSDGLLPMVDINFPHGSDCWWRLDDVSYTAGDLSTAGLQLIFQHRLGSYLQEDWGPVKAAPGTTTRAQFVKQLVDRIPKVLSSDVLGPGSERSQQIQFVCPELNVIQPLAGTNGGTTTDSTKSKANKSAQVNKTKGIGYGASLTVKGQAITKGQVDVCNIALRACDAHNASEVVMVAMIYAGMGESSLGADADTYSGVSVGVWQAQPPHYSGGHDTAGMANAWLTGGTDFQSGGGINAAKTYADAWQIANAVEANAVWNSSHTDSYGHEWTGGTNEGVSEAKAIVAAYGGGSSGTPGSVTTTTVTSDVGTLARGTSANEDEDSLTCLQRLASEVNWECYTTAHPAAGQWGNYLYYRTGPNNSKQMPSAYLVRSADNPGTWDLKASTSKAKMTRTNCLNQQPTYTVDNTAFSYSTTKTKHGKVQKATRIAKPQTPTQITIELVCNPLEYTAGDVFVFSNSGPIDGPWILSETERNIVNDDFDTIQLVPPTAPAPEPSVTSSTTSSTATGSTKSGTLASAVDLAKRAAALETQKHCYRYTQDEQPGDSRTNEGHTVLSAPYTFDCSGFCGAVYKFAGLGCPYGSAGYGGTSGEVNSGGACAQVSQGNAVPGDLVTFGPGGSDHVAIWIGNGQVVNMGGANQPYITTLQAEIDGHSSFGGFWHLKGAN
jgi:hypothetical protein